MRPWTCRSPIWCQARGHAPPGRFERPPADLAASLGRMRRVGTALLSVALLGAAVGCGAQRHAAATSVAEVRAKLPPKRTGAWVHVTVVDGDRGTRVPGAFVRIGRRARITDRR